MVVVRATTHLLVFLLYMYCLKLVNVKNCKLILLQHKIIRNAFQTKPQIHCYFFSGFVQTCVYICVRLRHTCVVVFLIMYIVCLRVCMCLYVCVCLCVCVCVFECLKRHDAFNRVYNCFITF